MPGLQGLLVIIGERQDGWRRQADEDRRAMYRRPDAPPLPAAVAPDPGRRAHALSFHSLRRRLPGGSRA